MAWFFGASRFLGHICCAWDDDDLGVYQGAVCCSINGNTSASFVGYVLTFEVMARSYSLHQVMLSK